VVEEVLREDTWVLFKKTESGWGVAFKWVVVQLLERATVKPMTSEPATAPRRARFSGPLALFSENAACHVLSIL